MLLTLATPINGTPDHGRSSPGAIAFHNYAAPVLSYRIALDAGLADQLPVINSVSLEGGNLALSETNGLARNTGYVLPSSSWTSEGGIVFDANAAPSSTGVAP